MTNLNESSCDLKEPVWLSNSATIEDQNLLPVSAVRYGPHKYELYNANITIGSLQCQPETEEERFNAKVEFEGLEEKVNEIVLNLEQNNGTDQDLIQRVVELEETEEFDEKISGLTDRIIELEETNITIHENFDKIKKQDGCPTNLSSEYKIFATKCHYFEAEKLNFADAQKNCATKFGFFGGHLAEPQTAKRSKELNTYAEEILSKTNYWIGYDCLGRGEGNFRYPSTNTPLSFIGFYPGSSNIDGHNNEHCAAFSWTDSENIGKVDDKLCSDLYSSICEMKKIVNIL